MNEIVLSICIPTYNRCNSLDDLLASIDSIKTMIGYEIEICVSNNNSTDNTRHILEKWSSIYKIAVNHNATNIGFSGNMKKLLEIATGKWICYIGDDDLLISQNVIKVLSILSNVRTDAWVLIPTLNRNNPQSSWLAELRPGKYSWLQMQINVISKGVSSFGFIGCHIISRKYKRSNLDIPIGFCESWIHQNYWFLHLILRRDFYFTDVPLVEINSAVTTVRYSREMWIFLWLQRLNNFSNIVIDVKIGNLLLIQVFLREFFAISQNREWARFALFYPNSGGYRLKKVESKIKPNNRIDSKIIIVYLKIILASLTFFRFMRKLRYLSRLS
jgi:glycosyltransferase involved in cell wall biosynthesis